MHQSRPYGLHAIGLPLTDKDEAFVSNIAARITNLQALSGVDSMKMVYDLPDGGYVIVQDMGGNFRVISHKPMASPSTTISDGIEANYIPMLFSGTVTKPIVRDKEPVSLMLTEAARLRLSNYDPNATKPPKEIDLQRFRIDYDNKFSEFKSSISGGSSNILRTQYTQLRATWYSGAMSEVVQIVSGYGRQDFDQLPAEDINQFERARLRLPINVTEKIDSEMSSLRLPGYTGVPKTDGSIQFDYKFNDTNGVGFDEKNRPWLLRISSSGVWAMPLPIIPATRTNAFREYMEEVADQEILNILDRFGGMPSGESFPNTFEFEAWRRAGVLIKVCDTSDFYHHISYSSACGWSLNSRGSEGYNTCYDYYDDEGLGYGLTYKLKLNLVSSDDYFGAPLVEIAEQSEEADKLILYLQQLMSILTNGNDDRAISYKLRRAAFDDIYQRALLTTGDQDRDYWHNLEVKPISNHTGNVSEVYRGYLYHGAKFEYQPQIKFPEPLVGATISHDFLPLVNGRYKDKYPNSNTIMFAYYIGSNLKVVKYFVDWGSFTRSIDTNFEQYMTVGSWQQVEYVGSSAIQGYFYSSDIDDRKIVSPTETTTIIKGEDKGYDTKPWFDFDAPFAMSGSMYRNRYYTHKTNSSIISDESVNPSVCIPYFFRNAVIQTNKSSSSVVKSEGLTLNSVRDPYSYRYWTYDFVFAWRGMTISNPAGVPYPTNGNPVWVEEVRYSPSPANNFADSGDWAGGLPADYTWLIHPDSNVWNLSGGGGPPKVDTYSTTSRAVSEVKGVINLSMSTQPDLVAKKVPANGYYIGSPTELGGYFYRDGCQVVFGDTVYRNISESSDASSRAKWGYSKLADHKSAHIFIGVINE